jgi:hypothetical protein
MAVMADTTTAEEKKKALELRQFKCVLTSWPHAFPPQIGEIEQPKEPAADIRFRIADGSTYAVEITQLLRPDGKARVKACEKLLASLKPRLAQRLPGVQISLGFTDQPLPKLPDAIEQVEHLLSEKSRLIEGNQAIRKGLPAFLTHVQLWSATQADVFGGGVFEVPALTKSQVSTCILQKHTKIEGYRAHADAVALLIYCPMAPSHAQLAVPAEAAGWSFAHQFERVVLYAEDSDGRGVVWQ